VFMEHSKANCLLSGEHNYFAFLRYSYMFGSLTTFIRPSIRYFRLEQNAIKAHSLCWIPLVYNNYYNI